MVRINLYAACVNHNKFPITLLVLKISVVMLVVTTVFSLLYLNHIIKVYNKRYAAQTSEYSIPKFTVHNLYFLNKKLSQIDRVKIKEYSNVIQQNKMLGKWVGKATRLNSLFLNISSLFNKQGWGNTVSLKDFSIDLDTGKLEISELIRGDMNPGKISRVQKTFLESQGFEFVKAVNITMYKDDRRFYLYTMQWSISSKAKKIYSWGCSK